MSRPLAELCDPNRSICYGIVQPGNDEPNGLPIVRVKDLSGNRIETKSVMRVSREIESKYKRSRVRNGDVLISLVGSMGQVAIASEEIDGWNIARAVGLIPAIDRHHAEWIKFALQSPEAQTFIRDHANTTVQATFNLKDLARIPIPYPSARQREEITAILGALDDKIELNRKTAATLDEMARALYRSWFVDFDPVRARAEGRAPAHMDAATAALFPDRFGEDGLPVGWQLASIYEVARVQYGASFASAKFNTSKKGRPLVRIRDLKSHQPGVWTTEVLRNEFLIRPGDIVVGMDGDFTPFTWCSSEALMNQRVCCFIPVRERDRAFVRLCISGLLKTEEDAAVATTVIHLGKKDIDKFQVPLASQEVMEAFSCLTLPWYKKVVAFGLQNHTLSSLRDTLLPRLMSGELRVDAARELVEELA